MIVAMEHTTKDGEPKILKACSLPLTGMGVVHDIVTELGWMRVTSDGLELVEIAEGITPDEVMRRTEARLRVSADLREMTDR